MPKPPPGNPPESFVDKLKKQDLIERGQDFRNAVRAEVDDKLAEMTKPPASVKPPRTPSKIPLTLESLGKIIVAVLAIAGTVIGAVIYLEHRFSKIEEELAAMRINVRSLKENNDSDHEVIISALEALDSNQTDLATELIYCCELSKDTAKTLSKSNVKGKPKKIKIKAKGGGKKSVMLVDPLGGLSEHYKTNPTKDPEDMLGTDLVFKGNPGIKVIKKK